ncbi:permease [Enterobacter asburiae]|nr:permease [Enterobacter asburiae]
MDNNTLSVKEKIGYGMGDAGCNIIFGAIMLFVNYFYTDIFGLAPALVGVLLLSVRVIDAVTDPIMGRLPTVPAANMAGFVHGCCGSPSPTRCSAS